MKNRINHISIATAVLISSSANAFWGSDISLEKERVPLSPEWVEKNDNEVIRKIFELDKSALPELNHYIAEIDPLFRLKYIDFDTISTLDPTQLQLNYKGKEASLLREQYVVLINSVKEVVGVKLQQRQQLILDSEKLSKSYQVEIARLAVNQQGYKETVQAVYNLKYETLNAQALSEQTVKDLSATLVAQLNDHVVLPKPLKSKYFERPKMKVGHCDNAIISKKTSVVLAYDVQGFCFTSKFRVEKNSADSLLNDAHMMSELESKITAIALEKIKQGDTFKKAGGMSGYKQQIRAFSHGGIEDVKRAAKAQYGNTDKGFRYKIKSLNEKLVSNNRKITTQKTKASIIQRKALIHSEELKALRPLSDNLDNSIERYLNAQLLHIIGDPIKESSEDYKLIELDESEGVFLVEDSYPSDAGDRIELYLINPTVLQQNSAIKKHFDGKKIPTRAAAQVDGLLLWRGDDANYARVARSLIIFLSRI